MDSIAAAGKLRTLLILHDAILKQIQQQDSNIDSISRRLLADGFCKDEQKQMDMSIYYLRLSVATGVKVKLDSCRVRLIQQVKKISSQIIASLQTDETTFIQHSDIEEPSSSVAMDTAAIQYTNSMTAVYRTD